MDKYERIDLSKCRKIRGEFDIPGNSTSVTGEYELEGFDETLFFKEDGRMCAANNDESIRELLASEILDILDIPHAKISLAYNPENKTTGCFSHNILKENERFIERDSFSLKPVTDIESYVNRELDYISTFPKITCDSILDRRKTVIKQIYINCILNNYDIKPDNMPMVYNNKTHEIRSSELFDFGVAFSDKDRFIYPKNYESMIEELYGKYYEEIREVSQSVKEKLTPEKLEELLSKPIYKEGFKGKDSDILNGLNDRIEKSNEYVTQINRLENPQTISINEIKEKCCEEKTPRVDISLIDKVSNFMKYVLSKNKEVKEK